VTDAGKHPALRSVSSKRWTQAVSVVLVAVFLAIGWIQARQSKLLDSAIYYNEENISWVFFQLEQEYLALRDSLRQAERYPQKVNPEALRERYEIFVSSIALVQSMQVSSLVAPLLEHAPTVGLIRQFIDRADAVLSEKSLLALKPELIVQLLREMDPLGEPIHGMSLLTTEVMGKTVSNRNAAAREQLLISLALGIFQGLLTLAFAAMLIRQVRSLENRSHELERATDEILRLNSELEERVRQRTTQLEAANRELEAFSYSVSHDLRSPLKSIDGFSHLLERLIADQLGDKAQHYLNRIRAGVLRMGELIDGLLSLAQLSRDTLRFSEVDLTAMARRIEQELREQDPDRQAHISIQNEMRVTGDRRQLLAVMQNLMGNAWKFTSRRELAHIEIGRRAGVDHESVYFVKDNGAGFDMAYAEKLFGTFERLHSPADFAGTGIGLATVKRVIERHGGRVWAEGKEREGAIFFFTLGTAEVAG
jgi:signal transduction histidine kinase